MANQLRIERVLALPGVLTPETMYFVRGATGTELEIYITGTSAAEVRHIINKGEIQALITAAVGDFTNIQVVATIAARDALAPTRNVLALVADATADLTVAVGAALYIFDNALDVWTKVSEFESLDVQLTWASLADKPTSTVAAIDDAVTKAHTHANKAVLDKLSLDGDQRLLVDGVAVQAAVAVAEW